MILSALQFLIVPWMGWTSRMSGGGWPKLPWNTDQLLYSLPILLFWPYMADVKISEGFVVPDYVWMIAAYLAMFGGKLMGTRQYLDGGTWKGQIRKPNNVDFLISWLSGKVNPRTYDFVGNTVMGIVSVLIPAAILMIHGCDGYALLFGGAMRGFAYAIGWGLDDSEGSRLGEILSGTFIGYTLWLAI